MPFESFDHQPRTRIVCGPNTVDRLGELVSDWNARRVLLVTDPHIVEAGHADRGRAAIESAGLEVAVFDGVRENPTTEDVDAALAVARSATVDTIVGLGGGSSLDTAKGCNFILTNGGKMSDYKGRGKASKPMLPLVAVPTTAGTGSECQSFALIADADTHMKMPCGDPKAAPRIALLDPTLTVT
ncbi:MAG: iron-containing alcohol dehydrogenase, partial [Phycisphaeraceae bacterium]|nr:iron-containing alcohol dehydrogenase [Phycisphaeraceae bacterium]